MASPHRTHRSPLLLLVLLFGLVAAACGDDASGRHVGHHRTRSEASTDPVTVRLGYFPNLTHAPGIVGDLGGYFEDTVGDNVTIETSTFNAGPEAVEALFAEALDITLIGPNPAINAFAQSDGEAIRIVSGSTSGGAFLVVREGIDTPEDLEGVTLATPQLGNTQDVALRAWLKEQGYETDDAGGGDVSIQPQANGDALGGLHRRRHRRGLGARAVGHPLHPGGRRPRPRRRGATSGPTVAYVTTHLIVRTAFLEDHPDVVKGIIDGLADAIDLIESDPDAGQDPHERGHRGRSPTSR